MSDATAREHAETETGELEPGLRLFSISRRELIPATRLKLTRLLLLKAAAEALFVVALASSFFYYTFVSRVHGAIDDARMDGNIVVTGWAVDDAEPTSHVEVQLFIDGRFASSRLADEPRTEYAQGENASGERHGFVFQLPQQTSGEHEARVYAVRGGVHDMRRTLHLVGHPISLRAMSSAMTTRDEVKLSWDETQVR